MSVKRITRGAVLIGKGGFTVIAKGTTSIGNAPLDDGTGATKTFAVTGVKLGDHVLVANTAASLGGVTVTGYVDAAGTVGVRLQNESGGTASVGTATYNYLVLR